MDGKERNTPCLCGKIIKNGKVIKKKNCYDKGETGNKSGEICEIFLKENLPNYLQQFQEFLLSHIESVKCFLISTKEINGFPHLKVIIVFCLLDFMIDKWRYLENPELDKDSDNSQLWELYASKFIKVSENKFWNHKLAEALKDTNLYDLRSGLVHNFSLKDIGIYDLALKDNNLLRSNDFPAIYAEQLYELLAESCIIMKKKLLSSGNTSEIAKRLRIVLKERENSSFFIRQDKETGEFKF